MKPENVKNFFLLANKTYVDVNNTISMQQRWIGIDAK